MSCLNSMAKESIVQFIELLTLISSLFIGLLVLLFVLKFVLKKDTKLYQGIVHFLQEHYLFLGFLVSLVATLGSLFYSDVMKLIRKKYPRYVALYTPVLIKPDFAIIGTNPSWFIGEPPNDRDLEDEEDNF